MTQSLVATPTKRMERLAHLTTDEQALMVRVGARISSVRTSERRRTIASVAELAAIDASYLGELERGRVNPSLATLSRVAVALGVPVKAFVDDG
jgi:transcriptional regulator with XRE-family HTH domain